jgi:two-component system sensor histidine kinase QseC
LAREVSSREPTRLEALILENTPREVWPLIEQINGLFARIRTSMENERRFTADASHELRTPIAAIRAQAQVARELDDPTERRDTLNKVLLGCDRATHLIEQLLTLARLETGKWTLPLQTLNLKQLAQSSLAELGGFAHQRGVDLELTGEEASPVHGNDLLLKVLIRNLVDNAIRYSPNPGQVRVNIAQENEGIRLTVTDQGPGIPQEERQRVLDRFYRGDGNTQSGSGLGLSIVCRIAEMHGAKLELEDGDNGRGLRVCVRF